MQKIYILYGTYSSSGGGMRMEGDWIECDKCGAVFCSLQYADCPECGDFSVKDYEIVDNRTIAVMLSYKGIEIDQRVTMEHNGERWKAVFGEDKDYWITWVIHYPRLIEFLENWANAEIDPETVKKIYQMKEAEEEYWGPKKLRVVNSVSDITGDIIVGEIVGETVKIGDEIYREGVKIFQVKEEEKETTLVVRKYPAYYNIYSEHIKSRVREENMKRAEKILSGLTGRSLRYFDLKKYLWADNYPVLLLYDRYVLVVKPYFAGEEDTEDHTDE